MSDIYNTSQAGVLSISCRNEATIHRYILYLHRHTDTYINTDTDTDRRLFWCKNIYCIVFEHVIEADALSPSAGIAVNELPTHSGYAV